MYRAQGCLSALQADAVATIYTHNKGCGPEASKVIIPECSISFIGWLCWSLDPLSTLAPFVPSPLYLSPPTPLTPTHALFIAEGFFHRFWRGKPTNR